MFCPYRLRSTVLVLWEKERNKNLHPKPPFLKYQLHLIYIVLVGRISFRITHKQIHLIFRMDVFAELRKCYITITTLINHIYSLHTIFAKSLDPVQARQNVAPDLDINCLTL